MRMSKCEQMSLYKEQHVDQGNLSVFNQIADLMYIGLRTKYYENMLNVNIAISTSRRRPTQILATAWRLLKTYLERSVTSGILRFSNLYICTQTSGSGFKTQVKLAINCYRAKA